ncbi:DUF1366 domain-containing protein [Streptococcus australis]|uniref:DUF1366 domain-containing protein n=1 Tax=Streptococcus australis TaxID=113107 RepID=UPI0039C26789
MRTYAVVGKYPVYDEDGKITHTDISLNATSGGFDSFTQRVAGDHRNKPDAEAIELAKDAYFKSEYAEKAMSESVQEIDNLKIKAKERDLKVQEQKEQLETINKLVENNAKLTQVSILNAVMSKNIVYGTIYKQYMDLLPIAKTGDTFRTDDLFVLEDPSHEEVDGEGIKILIQAQKTFAYNGESVKEFMKGGKLELGTATAWPFVGKE